MYAKVLESPVEFSMRNGEVSEIRISEHEPHWSVNIKKALVSLVKIQTPSGKFNLQENTINRGESSFPNIWKVMEQGVESVRTLTTSLICLNIPLEMFHLT